MRNFETLKGIPSVKYMQSAVHQFLRPESHRFTMLHFPIFERILESVCKKYNCYVFTVPVRYAFWLRDTCLIRILSSSYLCATHSVFVTPVGILLTCDLHLCRPSDKRNFKDILLWAKTKVNFVIKRKIFIYLSKSISSPSN